MEKYTKEKPTCAIFTPSGIIILNCTKEELKYILGMRPRIVIEEPHGEDFEEMIMEKLVETSGSLNLLLEKFKKRRSPWLT